MNSITEGMRKRKRIVETALKLGNNAEAARKHGTTRQYVAYWVKRYDGSIESLRKKSRRPHSHPNQHTPEEIELIKHHYRYHKKRGLAHVYRKVIDAGYTRSFDSMRRQIKKFINNTKNKIEYRRRKKSKPIEYNHPGEMVQIDIKYVPIECIGFASNHPRYYQIDAIDVYSRKKILMIVDEKSTYNTSKFLKTLEEQMGFKIDTIQTDNGTEFCNDYTITNKLSLFEYTAMSLNIKHIRTKPYSPWMNGYIERSHREDEVRFYQNNRFKSEEEMIKKAKRYNSEYNNTYRKVLGYKSPNEVVAEFFKAG